VAGSIQAVHLGHLEIDHDQVRFRVLETLDCFPSIAGLITDEPIAVVIQ
jgi:hypothetical protein